jgi:hypothetical protein
VTCEADPESTFPACFSGGVVVTLRDGRRLRHHEAVNRGAGERALTGDDIAAKFLENAERVVSRRRAEEVRAAVLAIKQLSARQLSAVLRSAKEIP